VLTAHHPKDGAPVSDLRRYRVEAESTPTFGRVQARCRQHDFFVDGPVENGCPGEHLTPGELFLGGVATCAVELIQVIARQRDLPLRSVAADIDGTIDREHPVRADLSVFNRVALELRLTGVGDDDAARLVESFAAR
jgi:uncharacterized OsmC-like protein